MKSKPQSASAPSSLTAQPKSGEDIGNGPEWRPVASAQVSLLKLWAQCAVDSLSKSGDEPPRQKSPAEHRAG
jgi:hypothetical protein